MLYLPLAVPGFPGGGRGQLLKVSEGRQSTTGLIFPENCMEMKEILVEMMEGELRDPYATPRSTSSWPLHLLIDSFKLIDWSRRLQKRNSTERRFCFHFGRNTNTNKN